MPPAAGCKARGGQWSPGRGGVRLGGAQQLDTMMRGLQEQSRVSMISRSCDIVFLRNESESESESSPIGKMKDVVHFLRDLLRSATAPLRRCLPANCYPSPLPGGRAPQLFGETE